MKNNRNPASLLVCGALESCSAHWLGCQVPVALLQNLHPALAPLRCLALMALLNRAHCKLFNAEYDLSFWSQSGHQRVFRLFPYYTHDCMERFSNTAPGSTKSIYVAKPDFFVWSATIILINLLIRGQGGMSCYKRRWLGMKPPLLVQYIEQLNNENFSFQPEDSCCHRHIYSSLQRGGEMGLLIFLLILHDLHSL